MANFNDAFADFGTSLRRGIFGQLQQSQVLRARQGLANPGGGLSIIDPSVDEAWAAHVPQKSPSNYFDYFFSGQDIRVYVDGTEDDPDFGIFPVISIAWGVQQQKQPVHGFWSYCVDDQTEALTMRGWVNGWDINQDDFILSMKPDGQLAWSPVNGVYRSQYDDLMFRATNANIDALVTPGHKFPLVDGSLKSIDNILKQDRLRIMGDALDDVSEVYTDAFVELVGWYVTEGHDRGDVNAIEITQSRIKNADKLDRIRLCLKRLGTKFSEWEKSSGVVKIYIGTKQSVVNQLKKAAPSRVLSMDFLLSLSTLQRQLLIETMLDGDGCRPNGRGRQYIQKDPNHVDAFVALCAMAGIATTVGTHSTGCFIVTLKWRKVSEGYSLNLHGGEKRYHPDRERTNRPTVLYHGLVWCPETEYGTFVCRRGGRVYVTGNTYDAVMRGSRVISGQFTIATQSPDYMRRLLSKAAETRSTQQSSYTYFKGLTEDDTNIEKYWGKNLDPGIGSSGKQVFSVHPPFSFILVYGIQSVSIGKNAYSSHQQAIYEAYQNNNPLAVDVNERLMESDPTDNLDRIVLDACELTEMQTGYGSDGSVVFETYSFFARDMLIASRGTGTRGAQQLSPAGGPFRIR